MTDTAYSPAHRKAPRGNRLKPDGVPLGGTICMLVGYFSPWSGDWTGYDSAGIKTANWVALQVFLLLAALVASLWSREPWGAAWTLGISIVSMLLLGILAVEVVAGRGHLGIGLMLTAIGFGLSVAGSIRAMIRAALTEAMAPGNRPSQT
jgi:hypothetical protein